MKLVCGDSLLVLPGIATASVDVVITDPPYGDTSLCWDKVVFGWIPEVARVLKPDAGVWVFGSIRYLAPLFAQFAMLGFKYSQDIVWEKQNGTGFHTDRFRRVHEHAVLFYRGAWKDIVHDAQYTYDATAKTVRRKRRPAHFGDIGPGFYKSEDGGPRLMRSVMKIRNEHGRAIHPTQKPEEIIRVLLNYSSRPGDIVLDPFMGSGTTGVCAGLLDRHFIGIEKDEDMFKKAEKRIIYRIGLDLV